MSHVDGVRKIAVLRANAIGDYVFCLPALQALRAAYPAAEIVLIGKRWHATLLAGRPGPVDRVIALPDDCALLRADPGAASAVPADVLDALRAERFDLALQWHGGGAQSNPLVRALGARVTAGAQAHDAAPLDRTVPYVYFQPQVLRYLELAALVGASPVTIEPHFAVTPADAAAVAPLLSASTAADAQGPAQPLVVLHPGATDARRRWPLAHFARVGAALRDAGARLVLNGDAGERDLCAALLRLLGGRALDLSGRLSLHGLVGLLARAAVVVANDTGPLHLAHAVGTRSVGLFWAYNMVNCAPLTRARHRPFAAWRMHCPVCGAHNGNGRCAHDVSFIDEIDPAPVAAAALDLLQASRRAAAPSAIMAARLNAAPVPRSIEAC